MATKLLIIISITFLATNLFAKAKKPDGVTCIYKNSTKLLKCNSTIGSELCQTDILGITNEFHTYRIGILKNSRGKNGQTWFRLYALKEEKSGWYYFKGEKNSHMRLTVYTSRKKSEKQKMGFVVLDNDCWSRLKEIIKSSAFTKTIKIERYGDEGLYENDQVKVVKTIGSIKIVD